ncbi:MAG: aminopeptidase, partial [Caldilineaceae bacterium]|nr:aminopeptidase [Caldilineaceae bacterium]
MNDPRIDKLADTLVNYCTNVRKGDWVYVHGHVIALPLVEAVVGHVLRAGGNPTVNLTSDGLSAALFDYATDEQLRWLSPFEETIAERADARIMIGAAENTRNLSHVDPQRQQVWQNARRDIRRRIMARSAAGEHRWVGTQYPCAAYAQEADMSLAEYEDFVYAATYADQPDPVACWQEVHDTQQRLIDWLAGKDEVVVRGPHVDLRLSIAGRTFI